jgi:hypothetical protein
MMPVATKLSVHALDEELMPTKSAPKAKPAKKSKVASDPMTIDQVPALTEQFLGIAPLAKLPPITLSQLRSGVIQGLVVANRPDLASGMLALQAPAYRVWDVLAIDAHAGADITASLDAVLATMPDPSQLVRWMPWWQAIAGMLSFAREPAKTQLRGRIAAVATGQIRNDLDADEVNAGIQLALAAQVPPHDVLALITDAMDLSLNGRAAVVLAFELLESGALDEGFALLKRLHKEHGTIAEHLCEQRTRGRLKGKRLVDDPQIRERAMAYAANLTEDDVSAKSKIVFNVEGDPQGNAALRGDLPKADANSWELAETLLARGQVDSARRLLAGEAPAPPHHAAEHWVTARFHAGMIDLEAWIDFVKGLHSGMSSARTMLIEARRLREIDALDARIDRLRAEIEAVMAPGPTTTYHYGVRTPWIGEQIAFDIDLLRLRGGDPSPLASREHEHLRAVAKSDDARWFLDHTIPAWLRAGLRATAIESALLVKPDICLMFVPQIVAAHDDFGEAVQAMLALTSKKLQSERPRLLASMLHKPKG